MKKTILPLVLLIVLAGLRGFGFPATAGTGAFPHASHEGVFEDCSACHSGIVDGAAYDLSAVNCGDCHDGDMLSGWTAPPASGNFTFDHGPHVDVAGMDCADCHQEAGSDQVMAVVLPAAESCFECHGEGGVAIHEPGFELEHRTAAVTEALDCATCHMDQFCEQCHDATSRPGFHQRNFVMRHGAEAHARDTDCASCHSTEVFCRECHAQAGLAPQGGLVNGSYHDREPFWLLSHGQAGRQDLETCVSCHRQSDCLQCHSASSGWKVSPHGPDFDPTRVSERNLQMCRQCHSTDPRP